MKCFKLLVTIFLLTIGLNTYSQSIYTLLPDEEFVYGKIGKSDNGDVLFHVAVVRKQNLEKEVWAFYGDYYGVQPLGASMRKVNVPEEYDKYDYWLIFNGKKYGPYDHIYAIKDTYREIEDWISEDGQRISFVGTKNKEWHPIINSKWAHMYWGPQQAPLYDGTQENTVYAIQWSSGNWKMFENGKNVVDGSKGISQPIYSEFDQLLYASKDNDGYYIYLDHNKIDGPFSQIAFKGMGFIPGTTDFYFNTYTKAKFGNKEVIAKENETINSFIVSDNTISLVLYNINTKTNTIYAYDILSQEIKSSEEFANSHVYARTNGYDNHYAIYDQANNQYKLLDKDFKEYWPKNEKKGSLVSSYQNLNGDMYVIYQTEDKKIHVEKNNQALNLNSEVARISIKTFPNASEPLFISNIDASVAGQKHHIKFGQIAFNLDGDLNAGIIKISENQQKVYHTVRTIEGKDWWYKLYRNGEVVVDTFYSNIIELSLSNDGNHFAFLDGGKYFTTNKSMHIKRTLVVDGKELEGNFGAPVWLSARNSFFAIKQVGDELIITDLLDQNW